MPSSHLRWGHDLREHPVPVPLEAVYHGHLAPAELLGYAVHCRQDLSPSQKICQLKHMASANTPDLHLGTAFRAAQVASECTEMMPEPPQVIFR